MFFLNISFVFVTGFLIFNITGQVLSEGDETPPQIPSCICYKKYDPICGTDNKTYSNLCTFDCAYHNNQPSHLDYACQGECPCLCICTLEYNPLCGSDGVTYANECEFLCEKRYSQKCLRIQHLGECNLLTIENNDDQK